MNKKITFKSLFALVICCFALNSLSAQVLIYEDFESGDESTSVGTLNGWTTSIPEFTFTQTDACVGSQSISAPLNGGNNTFVTSPTQNVQGGNDLDISFQYKVVNAANGNLISGNVVNIDLEYSLDGGATWVNYDTIDQNDLPTSDCSTNSFTIPSSNLTSTDTFTWRFTATNLSGDLLVFVDNFAAIEQVGCIQPVKITVDESSISFDEADITWIDLNNPNATEWEIIACTSPGNPGNGPSDPNGNPFCYPFGGASGGGTGLITVTGTPDPNTGEVNYTLTGLDDGQQYTVYVRAVCGPNDKSAWQSDSDALQFQTIAIGSYCSVAKDVQTLPYTDLDQMNRFGSDDYNGTPGGNCNSTSALLDGFEVVYEYTSPADDILSIDVTNLAAGVNTGVFVYSDCSEIGSICTDGVETQNGADVSLNSVFVDAGETIYIVMATIDSSGNPINTNYQLDINGFDCSTYGPPLGSSTIPFVAGQTLEDFTGFSNGIVTDPHSGPSIFLQWYPDNNGMPDFNNPITDPTSEVITDQDVYHVTQNVGNCESDYLTVTFNEISCDTDLGGVSGPQGDSVCENGQLTLSITKNPSQYDDSSEVYWFDSASGGEIVGVGDTFTTPDLSQTTSYWATEVFLGLGTITGQANPGPVTGSTSNANNGLYINAEETIIINTVDVYSAGSGNIIIEIKNQSGTYSETISRSVNAGTTADPTLTTLTINKELPGNDDYYIYKSSGPSLLYTPSANATFPYPLGPSASITSGATSTGATNSSYYYFYNWDIKGSTVLCETSPREEVVATVYDIEPISVSATDRIVCVNGTTDLTATSTDSDYQYTWTWNDSSGSNTDSGATITPTILGNTTFTVEAYNPNTTCSTSATIDITANGVEDLGVIPTSAQVCSDEIVRLTAGSEIYDFNNGSNGWTTQNNSTSPIGNAAATGWQIVNSPFSPNGYALENISSPDDSDYYISIADKLGSGGDLDNSLISPSFNLVGVASAELSFDYLFKDYTTSSYSTNNVTYFDVLVSEDNGATWEVVDNNIPGEFDPENFQSRTVDLDEYAGKSGVMIAFNFNGSWGWWLAIDNVVFKRDFADGFVSWSPTNDLYFDDQATIPYDGSPTNQVYFTQSNDGQYTYTATLDFTTCPDVTTDIDITVSFTDLPTTSSTTQTYTTGDTTGDLDVTGTDLNFYIQNQAGEYVPVTVNYLLEQGTTYYVTQTINDCESDYLEIEVELDCPQPTNLELINKEPSSDGTSASVVIEWDEPTVVGSVQDYILQVTNDNDNNNIVHSSTVPQGTNFKVVNNLPVNADLTAKIYSLCDPNIPVESEESTLGFDTRQLSADLHENISLSYYPNPTKDKVHFENTNVIKSIDVYNLSGQKVMNENIGSNRATISLTGLASGVYFASVQLENQKTVVRIVKE